MRVRVHDGDMFEKNHRRIEDVQTLSLPKSDNYITYHYARFES